MTENSLKPYLFDSFYRWTENNNLDVYLEFKTNNIVLPEYFKKKKRIKLKISKKTCFDLKIHTNGVSFFVYINKNKEDIFIPHSEWISLTSNNEILDFNTMSIKEKASDILCEENIPMPNSKIYLAWDADKAVKNEWVNKG